MQEINLYKYQAESTEPDISYAKLVDITFIVCVLLFCYGVFLGINVIYLQYKNHKLANQIIDLKQETTKTTQKLTKQQTNITALDTKLINHDSTTHMLNFISTVKNIDQGFSKYLLALSKQKISGLWLTEFKFTQLGADVLLKGDSINHDNIAELLQKLGETEEFNNKKFDLFNLEHDAETSLIKFTLENKL